jgi:3-hydroxy-9,10-secoandrosta-1,3,5(10)-triene-9,17-dione monooxygenase
MTMPTPPDLVCVPLLDRIRAQAETADRTRNLDAALVAAIESSDLIRLSATAELDGIGASVFDIGHELEAIAPVCGSTAWVLWNHLCVFHAIVGQLGPSNPSFLREVIGKRGMVSFPGGAGTGIVGVPTEHGFRLNGRAAFGTGARYGEWMSTVFMVSNPDTDADTDPAAPPDMRFTLTSTEAPGIRIEPTWDGSSVRASATDDVFFDDVEIRADRVAPFAPRAALRDPDRAAVHTRYREDWVAFAVLWISAMATGIAQAAIDCAVEHMAGRVGTSGQKIAELPIAHANLGEAQSKVAAARLAWQGGCQETDQRIKGGSIPTEDDYLRQMSVSMASVQLAESAMELVQRVLGGNGLREGGGFDRLYRDFQAIPLHITVHRDRVSEAVGRSLLGLAPKNPF